MEIPKDGIRAYRKSSPSHSFVIEVSESSYCFSAATPKHDIGSSMFQICPTPHVNFVSFICKLISCFVYKSSTSIFGALTTKAFNNKISINPSTGSHISWYLTRFIPFYSIISLVLSRFERTQDYPLRLDLPMESDHCFPQNCHSLSRSSLSASTNVVASAPQQQSEGLTNDMSSDDDLGHELSDSEHRGYRIVRILEPTHVQSDSSSLADHTHVEEAQAPATTQRDGAASRCQRSHSLASRFVRRLKASSAENPGNNKQGEPLVAKRRDSSQPCTEGLPDAAKSGDAGVIASDSDYNREALRLVRAFTSTNVAGYKEAV